MFAPQAPGRREHSSLTAAALLPAGNLCFLHTLHPPCICACSLPVKLQLVLINVSDHFTRFKANGPDGAPPPTVMGCLLGIQDGRSVDVVNSFEMRFNQGENGWEVDHAFLVKKQEQCECRTAFCSCGGTDDRAGWDVCITAAVACDACGHCFHFQQQPPDKHSLLASTLSLEG